ncbi:hypothetical protein ACJX0J_010629, partial [Zea mays]
MFLKKLCFFSKMGCIQETIFWGQLFSDMLLLMGEKNTLQNAGDYQIFHDGGTCLYTDLLAFKYLNDNKVICFIPKKKEVKTGRRIIRKSIVETTIGKICETSFLHHDDTINQLHVFISIYAPILNGTGPAKQNISLLQSSTSCDQNRQAFKTGLFNIKPLVLLCLFLTLLPYFGMRFQF